MVEPNTLKQLRLLLQPYSLLYVEDNAGLNAQATTLFQKLFDTVYSAYDGEEGLRLFQEHRCPIVITDITMPKIDGLMMADAILKIDPDVKIIITTAHDENDFLHKAIRVGIFDFLAKPLRIENLAETLTRCAHELKEILHRKIFNANLHTIFNYQNSLVALLQSQKVVMANQPCMDFFGVVNTEKLRAVFEGFGQLLLEHNGFLYEHEGFKWFGAITRDPGKLFNVKIAAQDDSHHHFILRYEKIPEKEGYGVLSLNDVTELGLLKLYDANSVEKERMAKDEKIVRGLLDMAMRNGVKIRVHNLYKGLSITNDGLIAGIDNKVILLKTPYVQLKAMQLEEEFYLTSELFPMTVMCSSIQRIDFEAQSVHFNQYRLVQTSPTRRAAIRVVPDESLSVTLLYEGRKFDSDISILDISINAARLLVNTLPAGMALKQSVVLDIVLKSAGRPVIINTEAEVYRINQDNNRYELVCVYELRGSAQKNMIDYIAKRQMVLIREFKGMQYEK